MLPLEAELTHNFEAFDTSSFNQLSAVRNDLTPYADRFLASYRAVTTLQAWRSTLLEHVIPADALAFFLEAQNDALLSHVLARIGMWRSSLQALRSCIENVFMTVFYKDHPVELLLWNNGKHKLGFAEVHTYLQHHPLIAGLSDAISGLSTLASEYATLSRAVHASAVSFRMTDQDGPRLWSADARRVGPWLTRHRQTITSLNLLLLCIFRDHLGGTKQPALRQTVALLLSVAKRQQVRAALQVAL
jgi:hypothetical protein